MIPQSDRQAARSLVTASQLTGAYGTQRGFTTADGNDFEMRHGEVLSFFCPCGAHPARIYDAILADACSKHTLTAQAR
jgi:hypothetical protein